MDDFILQTGDINDKLRWEEERLELLKDSLSRSDQLTENMLGILSSFESRLRKLEDTITPVYQETGNLQRRHENIEKTLNSFDHVIGYYHVAKEVEPAIREGPSAGLANYLQCMEKLHKAVKYFTTNNPGSPEMAHVTTLYEAGKDSLEREFRNLLTRHSKPVPAVIILDILAVDEELPNDEPQTMEHLPPRVLGELSEVAGWLLSCGEESDFMQVYGSVRASILLKSLQCLRDHLKTGSKDSATVMTHSPALGQKLKSGKDTPSKRALKRMAFVRRASTTLMKHSLAHLEAAASSVSRRPSANSKEVELRRSSTGMTPEDTKKRKSLGDIRRLSGVFEGFDAIRKSSTPGNLRRGSTVHESVEVERRRGSLPLWEVERRRSSVQLKEGLRRTGSGPVDKMDEGNEIDIDFYITGVSALLRLIQSEASLMQGIIPTKHHRKVFELLITPALDSIVREGEQIAANVRRAVARHDHQAVLAIFPVLKHLRAVKPEFDMTLEGCPPPTRAKLVTLISTLDGAGAKALEEFVDSIRNDPDKSSHMPKDGTVHQLASNTMIFLEQLLEFSDTAGAMLMTQDPTALSTVQSPDKPKVKLAEFITKVLSALGLNLSNKAETYGDVTLRAIFMLNNYNYILKSLRRTGLMDVVNVWNPEVGETYNEQIREHKRYYSQRTRMLALVQLLDPLIEHTYDQKVGDQKKIYANSWSRVLHFIMDASSGRPPNIASSPDGSKLKDKDRQAIKDRFTGFNKEMEEICRVQKGYAIPDPELREVLKRDNRDFVLPKYEAFFAKFANLSFTKNPEKYIKFQPGDVVTRINNFFDAAA